VASPSAFDLCTNGLENSNNFHVAFCTMNIKGIKERENITYWGFPLAVVRLKLHDRMESRKDQH